MWQSLHDAWWRLATQSRPRSLSDALASRVLQAASVPYRAAVWARNLAYDRGWVRPVTLPCRVVSVGNLTVGGTGKTACVELIAKKLAARGLRVAVLSRGYGGARRSYWLRWEQGRLSVDGADAAGTDGLADEPQLLARRLPGVPILVGARRHETGERACRQFGADVVILDDGFQHRRVARDCEIVLVHASMPLGGWAVLPRGPMREPLSSLSRAHVVIATKANEALGQVGALGERLRAFNPQADFLTASHEPMSLMDGATQELRDPHRLQGLRVGLLSSIGDPSGFEATMWQLQATILWHRSFPDHYRYEAEDWTAILEEIRRSRPEAIVTTEKDWVRLRPLVGVREPSAVPVWVLGIQMQLLSGEDRFDARLAGLSAR